MKYLNGDLRFEVDHTAILENKFSYIKGSHNLSLDYLEGKTYKNAS